MSSREGEPVPDWGDFESADTFPRPFGTYILLHAFARGGMGEVYLAKSGGIAGLEKYCVLKKLRPELTLDREYVQRFIDEARVVVQLNHANIAQVFDVGRVGPEYYLAMEYVSGRDLRTLQDRAREMEIPLPIGTILHLVCEVLEALDYAHRRKHPLTGEDLHLVHRDVSPQNVLISFEGEVKLIDFGLAQSRMKKEATSPNIVMGKMAYMAPEQARGDPIDARADLFAAGVMLYEFIANERFYEGMTAQEIWQVVGRGGFRPRKWGEVDEELREILDKALAPDRDDRYATCGELEAALSDLLHTHYGGQPSRASLRLLVETLFGEEISSERDQLHKFGRVQIKAEEAEASRSMSVSLLATDDDSDAVAGVTRIARDEGGGQPDLDEWGAPIVSMEVPDTIGEMSGDHPSLGVDSRGHTPPTGVLRAEDTSGLQEAPQTTVDAPAGSGGSGKIAAVLALVIVVLVGAVGFIWTQRDKPVPAPPGNPEPINVEPPDEPSVVTPDPSPEVDPRLAQLTAKLEEGQRALDDKGYPDTAAWPDEVRAAFEAASAEGEVDARAPLVDRFVELAGAAASYSAPRPRPKPKPKPKPRPKAVSTDEMVRAVKSCPCGKEVFLLKVKADQNPQFRSAFRKKLNRCYESCK